MSLTGGVSAHNHSTGASGGVLPLVQPISETKGESTGNPLIVTLGFTNVVSIDLGSVVAGDNIDINATLNMLKGATAGDTTLIITKDSGTAAIEFLNNQLSLRSDNEHRASQQWTFPVFGKARVTVSGTLILIMRASSAGSNGTVNLGDGELFAKVTRNDSSAP